MGDVNSGQGSPPPGVNLDELEPTSFFGPEDLDDLLPLIQDGTLTSEDVQNFLLEDRNDTASGCPLGYICGEEKMANCTLVRISSVVLGFGDIHAGAYCPEGEERLLNCPVGHFCETPETLQICPKGKFCPHKTFMPEIDCHRCEAGEERLKRDL